MIESLSFYLPNVLATLFGVVALALLGSQLAARSESLHALVASQSASLGITIGLALLMAMEVSVEEAKWAPWIASFVVSTSVYALGQTLCLRHRVKSSQILVALFLFSLALNYLLTAWFPSLEAHFSSTFMGDIATASALDSWCLVGVSAAVGIWALLKWKSLVLSSFWISSSSVVFYPWLNRIFYVLCAVLIIESTRSFGFLFTTSSLVVVPLFASLAGRALGGYVCWLVFIGLLGTSSGFLISLAYQQISTSAAIVLGQLMAGGLSVVWRLMLGDVLSQSLTKKNGMP